MRPLLLQAHLPLTLHHGQFPRYATHVKVLCSSAAAASVATANWVNHCCLCPLSLSLSLPCVSTRLCHRLGQQGENVKIFLSQKIGTCVVSDNGVENCNGIPTHIVSLRPWGAVYYIFGEQHFWRKHYLSGLIHISPFVFSNWVSNLHRYIRYKVALHCQQSPAIHGKLDRKYMVFVDCRNF